MPDLSAGRPLPLPEKQFTEEDVDHLAQVMRDANTREAWSAATYPLMPMAHFAEVMLDHLARSGRLLPPSAEHREESPPSTEVFKTWYRSKLPDGTVWCESSDPAEVVELSAGEGCLFERLVIELVTNPWEPWTPAHDGSAE